MDIATHLWEILGEDSKENGKVVGVFLAIFDRLPSKMKLVVDFKVQGLPNKLIAKQLGISEVTVRIHLRRAKKRILTALE